MRDKSLGKNDMPDVFVSNARDWAVQMINREARGPGDLEGAMRRFEGRYGISWQTLWRLRHGRIKDISASIYARIQAAYIAECDRQCRLLSIQIEIAKTKGLAGSAAVAKAEALVEEMEEG